MIAFIFISIILLSIAIYSVFLLLSVFFLANKLGNAIILISLLTASLGFLLTLFLAHSFNNIYLRIFYRVFSLSVGLLFYLTVFAIGFQLIKIIFPAIPITILIRTGVILSVALFLVGLIETGIPRIKNISVGMTNLPENWRGKKIVQISDIHLGNFYGVNFLRNQVETINSLNPDLVVITGDLFDGTESDLTTYIPELKKLKSKNGVFFVSGNHDTYLGLARVIAVLQASGIRVLQDEAVDIDGLEIIGLSFLEPDHQDGFVIKNLSSNPNPCRLLLKHVPTGISSAKKIAVSLQLSGHSHRGQMFPLAILTRAIYGKYQYGLHTEGNFNIYTSSGLGSWGPPVRTFNQPEIIVITLN